ncbi:MAG: YceH family protein [Wenzhouxiangellaceae bacterium]|nr:YceH family protein [Wenzhouxiangellaceae bacterium]
MNQDALPLDPPLSAEEARVLGCLIEKEATTPENYPLTVNATVSACNQKTSREPVMELESGRVGMALRKLEQRGLADSEYGARAERWRHTIEAGLRVTREQRALLCLMLLRGPQTLSELASRSGRLVRFDELEDVQHALERLASREPALVVRLPRGPGQREERWMHRLAGPVAADAARRADRPDPPTPASPVNESALEARIAELEERVAALEQRLEE